MRKDLLVCIAFHYDFKRLVFLEKLIHTFLNTYECSVHIRIDTNCPNSLFFSVPELIKLNNTLRVEIFTHENLAHPFHLTWQHRLAMQHQIDQYENFAYFEDDILLPYENYLNYLENFKLLFPKYVPSFVRIEENEGQQFITDATEPQELRVVKIYKLNPYEIGDEYPSGTTKCFALLKNPYHGFWIMPAKELKETMIPNFVRLHESRETAASYPMWELKLTPLVEIEDGQISKKCYSYHLPNNYCLSKESPYAKIKPENLFI